MEVSFKATLKLDRIPIGLSLTPATRTGKALVSRDRLDTQDIITPLRLMRRLGAADFQAVRNKRMKNVVAYTPSVKAHTNASGVSAAAGRGKRERP